MKAKNPTVINQEVQKYCNDIIKEVYYINAHSISDLHPQLSALATEGSDFIESESVKSKFGIKAVVAGYSNAELTLLKNYLNNLKQTHIKKVYRIPLRSFNVVTGEFSASAVVAKTMDYYTVFSIEVPDGFDGNVSFVKVVPDIGYIDPAKGEAVTQALSSVLEDVFNEEGISDMRDNALLYYAPKLSNGAFSIDVAKSTKIIDITIDTSGIKDISTWEYNPYVLVQVMYFKRGVR